MTRSAADLIARVEQNFAERNRIFEEYFARESQALARLITKLGPLPSIADLGISEVMEAIRRDKKVINGRLHFVIAIEIGATMTVDDVSEDELRGVLMRLGLKG